jgi:hypothetical protein
VEEWRYRALDEFGGDVTVNFDPSSSSRAAGGEEVPHRISGRVAAIRGCQQRAAARRPFALTYPNHYVYLSFPIDKEATAIKWQLRGRSQDTSDLVVAQDIAELLGERGPLG